MIKYRNRGSEEAKKFYFQTTSNQKKDIGVHFILGAPNNERNRENRRIFGVAVHSLTLEGEWTGGSTDYRAQIVHAKDVLTLPKIQPGAYALRFLGGAA